MKMTIKRHRRVTKHRKETTKGTTKGTTKPRKSIRRIKNRKLKTRRQSGGGGWESFITAGDNPIAPVVSGNYNDPALLVNMVRGKGIDVKFKTEKGQRMWLIGGNGFMDATFGELQAGAKEGRYQLFISVLLEKYKDFNNFDKKSDKMASSKGIILTDEQFCNIFIDKPNGEPAKLNYTELKKRFEERGFKCRSFTPSSAAPSAAVRVAPSSAAVRTPSSTTVRVPPPPFSVLSDAGFIMPLPLMPPQPPGPLVSPNVQKLIEMGFDEANAKKALESARGNIQTAAEILLSAAESEQSATARGGVVEAQSSAQKATIQDFLNAQSGRLPLQLGGGVCPTYAQALSEINAGQKEGHWIWYILPSSPGHSATSKFFGIDKNATVTPEEYLANPFLLIRYVQMLNTIGAKLSDHLLTDKSTVRPDDVRRFLVYLMGSEIDYNKLRNSLTIFSDALRTKGNVGGNIVLLAFHLGVQLYAQPPGPPPHQLVQFNPPPTVPTVPQYVAPSSAAPAWVKELETMGFNSTQIQQALSAGMTTLNEAIDFMNATPLPKRDLPIVNLSFTYKIADLMFPDEFVKNYARAYGLQFDQYESYQPDTHGRNLTQFAANTNCPEVADWTVMQTIGDGNCLTHAFLQCMSSNYRKMHVDHPENPVEKSAVAQAFRLAFARINDPLYLDQDTAVKNEFTHGNGLTNLGEGTFASYARLFGVILVVFDVRRNNQLLVANLTEKSATLETPVIFVHGDGAHYSSVTPALARVSNPAEPFVIKYKDAITIQCLTEHLNPTNGFALNG
jgi:uncharacterized protein (DUF1810 family)